MALLPLFYFLFLFFAGTAFPFFEGGDSGRGEGNQTTPRQGHDLHLLPRRQQHVSPGFVVGGRPPTHMMVQGEAVAIVDRLG